MQGISLVITVFLAITGYLATYYYNLMLSRRKERLELVNQRINGFYGPLYISMQASKASYTALRDKMNRESLQDLDIPLSNKEMDEWRIWSKSVFMPLNISSETLILQNAHLILEEEMPRCLIDFITHVSAYKAILEKWEVGSFYENFTLIDFPIEMESYVSNSYRVLKAEQMHLIRGSRQKGKS